MPKVKLIHAMSFNINNRQISLNFGLKLRFHDNAYEPVKSKGKIIAFKRVNKYIDSIRIHLNSSIAFVIYPFVVADYIRDKIGEFWCEFRLWLILLTDLLRLLMPNCGHN